MYSIFMKFQIIFRENQTQWITLIMKNEKNGKTFKMNLNVLNHIWMIILNPKETKICTQNYYIDFLNNFN